MELRRGIIIILVLASMTTLTVLPCSSEENSRQNEAETDIWTEEEPRGPGRGAGPGGPGRGGRGPGRYRTREEEIDHFLKELEESNPERAKELTSLRQKNPDKFKQELRQTIREHWSKRIESWRNRRREEFLEWLEKSVPDEAQALTGLKDTDADLYTKKFDLLRTKYWRVFEESKRNPELAEILMEEMELDERQERLLKEIKSTRDEREKKNLMAQLEQVVSNKYDLIIRKKIIAYEFLLKKIEHLKKELNRSREEITKWQDKKTKEQNVQERLQELTHQSSRFKWR